MSKKNTIEMVFEPKNGFVLYLILLICVYSVTPFFMYVSDTKNSSHLFLSGLTLCVVFSMFVGYNVDILDYRFYATTARYRWKRKSFITTVWIIFIIFIVITFATAPSIPILSGLKGASSGELSQERGDFLKGRTGFGIVLLYISTFLVNTVVPYSVVLLYSNNSKWRHFFGLIFFLFCISFLQKSLFLNLILPLLVSFSLNNRLNGGILWGVVVSSVMLLIAVTFLSLTGEVWSDVSGIQSGDYFSALYVPDGPFDYFIWRSVAVPIFTATDTLVVHAQQFNSEMLLGATSTFISGLFGMDRINIERFVFEYQFGGWNDIANSNSVFIVDSYINFGWGGAIFFGIFVGIVFRWFSISNDKAFKSLWIIFAFILFSAPLIGMLLSNGFLYMLIHALYIEVCDDEK